ncbi:MAG: hypothetical protein JSW50_16310 [Candidatus Latescibacterota bacterium]|nr:MAG: hypothetical protein JSW50_16310 [Candidatus Latescibacterota bacterium]
MKEEGCEHLDDSPIGKCAICGKTVCSECYRTVFSETICDEHEALEEESAWELVGLYADTGTLDEKRFELEEQGIASIVVEEDEDAVELYVPAEDKDDAYAMLKVSGDETPVCTECKIQYATDSETCPICGKTPADMDEEADPIEEYD